jgi:hypothetical protein
MNRIISIVLTGLIILNWSCVNTSKNDKSTDMKQYEQGTYGYDLNFLLNKDTSLIQLISSDGKSQIIVSPKYQGKVFTSTAEGLTGKSIGFVNYKALDSEVFDEHMNGYGGENRFWLGPEGGKYSVYFAPGVDQTFDNWHTPKPIDIEAWDCTSKSNADATLVKHMKVANYLGTNFELQVDREIKLLENKDVSDDLKISIDGKVSVVAYETKNIITNLNDFQWTKETGTICIWMLDMFNPGPKAVTVIPFNKGNEKELGMIVTSDYFGEIPADRLKVEEDVIYLKTDGEFRSKLGLNGKRTKAIGGNYDPDTKRLTIVTFDVDKKAVYLNQEWNPTKDPLKGDALNAYNDGPLEDGSIMGPFLELESVSPAAFLKPDESLTHIHKVFHFVGEEESLNSISQKLLGVSIEKIKSIF